MKFAYADPPYLGNGKRRYAPFHENAGEYDDVQAHLDLLARLVDEYPDGWALSCNPKDLRWVLPALPDTVRVCAWTKTFHQIRVNVSVQYAWEPVVLGGGRDMRHRRPMTRDWMACPIAMRKGLPGAKPAAFYNWVLDMIGWEEGDVIDDLFPGTNGLAEVISQRGSKE
jgi:hypothetical protein